MIEKPSKPQSFENVLTTYLNRRGFLKSLGLASAGACLSACAQGEKKRAPSTLSFEEVGHEISDTLEVSAGYDSQVLIRWGDPLVSGIGDFDPTKQSAADQLKRFGYNNDFIGFLSLPLASNNSDHGLLVVNHEYTNPELMFPGSPKAHQLDQQQVDVEIAAHGLSVVEIKRDGEQWQVVKDSYYNRRITPLTPMAMSGAAAGNSRLRSAISIDGVQTLGTYGNCAGGVTPWGTILTGEENVDGYFVGDIKNTGEVENYRRFGVNIPFRSWGRHYDRWNLEASPTELLHVGWIVEIDPYDPQSKPKKRTALGRFKHEGANVFINDDGRVVAYTADDQRFEYIYKFVSKNSYDPNNRAANMDLLDEGTLFVAKFMDNGELHWLPLVFGENKLTNENSFRDQGDIYIDARRAADVLGATPMDRPEDIEVNPANGKVYAMLTNNSQRKADQVDAVNPRPHNSNGQVLEFFPADGDHSHDVFRWELFLLAGNPGKTTTMYHPDISESGWLSCPDNCAFDTLGNLWIATDGAPKQGVADGLWATEVSGKNRALTRRFMRIPVGAEMCGPFFSPNDENLFCSVQHPGDRSTFDAPKTRWPDFDKALPPRPAVVVTRKRGGGRIGS